MEATIKAVVETAEGVRLQVSFGDETALIYWWQIVKEARCSLGPPELLKNGAFDGRREVYPDHGTVWMCTTNWLLQAMGSLQHCLSGSPGLL
jgi:hypothetical protein